MLSSPVGRMTVVTFVLANAVSPSVTKPCGRVSSSILVEQKAALPISVTEAGMITSGMNVNMKNADSVVHDLAILEYARIKGITIQAWSPFQQGFFGGSFIGSDKYPALNEKLNMLGEKYGVTPTAVATAWITRHPANIQVLAGTMNPERIAQICSGADVVLEKSEWYEIYRSAGHTLP